MPYCPLCDKQSPCKHWPSENETKIPRPYDDGLDTQIDNAVRGVNLKEAHELIEQDAHEGTRTTMEMPETITLNGYVYRRDDSASVP